MEPRGKTSKRIVGSRNAIRSPRSANETPTIRRNSGATFARAADSNTQSAGLMQSTTRQVDGTAFKKAALSHSSPGARQSSYVSTKRGAFSKTSQACVDEVSERNELIQSGSCHDDGTVSKSVGAMQSSTFLDDSSSAGGHVGGGTGNGTFVQRAALTLSNPNLADDPVAKIDVLKQRKSTDTFDAFSQRRTGSVDGSIQIDIDTVDGVLKNITYSMEDLSKSSTDLVGGGTVSFTRTRTVDDDDDDVFENDTFITTGAASSAVGVSNVSGRHVSPQNVARRISSTPQRSAGAALRSAKTSDSSLSNNAGIAFVVALRKTAGGVQKPGLLGTVSTIGPLKATYSSSDSTGVALPVKPLASAAFSFLKPTSASSARATARHAYVSPRSTARHASMSPRATARHASISPRSTARHARLSSSSSRAPTSPSPTAAGAARTSPRNGSGNPRTSPRRVSYTHIKASTGSDLTPSRTESSLTPRKSSTGSGLTPRKSSTGGSLTPRKASTGSSLTPRKASTGSSLTPRKASTGTSLTPRKGSTGSSRGITPRSAHKSPRVSGSTTTRSSDAPLRAKRINIGSPLRAASTAPKSPDTTLKATPITIAPPLKSATTTQHNDSASSTNSDTTLKATSITIGPDPPLRTARTAPKCGVTSANSSGTTLMATSIVIGPDPPLKTASTALKNGATSPRSLDTTLRMTRTAQKNEATSSPSSDTTLKATSIIIGPDPPLRTTSSTLQKEDTSPRSFGSGIKTSGTTPKKGNTASKSSDSPPKATSIVIGPDPPLRTTSRTPKKGGTSPRSLGTGLKTYITSPRTRGTSPRGIDTRLNKSSTSPRTRETSPRGIDTRLNKSSISSRTGGTSRRSSVTRLNKSITSPRSGGTSRRSSVTRLNKSITFPRTGGTSPRSIGARLNKACTSARNGKMSPRSSRVLPRGTPTGRQKTVVAETGEIPGQSDQTHLISGTRGKRPGNGSGASALKEVEFKLDIGKRRLPSPDVRMSVDKERAPEFVVKPRRQFVDEGQTAKFKVGFDGTPKAQLTWSRAGKPVEESSKYKMYEEGGYHYLEVRDVQADDSGIFVGTVQNPAGTDTASAELDVFEKPKLHSRGMTPAPTLSTSLQDMDVVIGDRDVQLTCDVTEGDNCEVTWFHNGKELRPGRRYRCRFTGGKTACLTLTEITEDDGGLYECVVSNGNGEVKTSCTLTTQEGEKFEPPVFIQELQDMEVEDGDKVELIVEVKGSQPIQVYWLHNNRQVTVDTPGCVLRAVDGVHSLRVPHATALTSGGEYVCEAYNDYGDTDTFCRINVSEVVDTPSPPDFLTRPKLVSVAQGNEATFTCRVQGQPSPKVTWQRNGQQLSTDQKYKLGSDGGAHSLQVVNPHYTDAGHYVCHVQNSSGAVNHTCTLVVTPATGSNNSNNNVNKTAAAATITNSTSATAAADFRALLRPSRQRPGQSNNSTDSRSQRSDSESRNFRDVLRNNRQTSSSPSPPPPPPPQQPPPPFIPDTSVFTTASYVSKRSSREPRLTSPVADVTSTYVSRRSSREQRPTSPVPNVTSTYVSKRSTSRGELRPTSPPTVPNVTSSYVSKRASRDVRPKSPTTSGTSTYGSSSSSSISSVSGRQVGGVRRNLDLFENPSSTSSSTSTLERASVAARVSSSPVEKTKNFPAEERHSRADESRSFSPARNFSPALDRRKFVPAQERSFSPVLDRRSQSPAVDAASFNERRSCSPALEKRSYSPAVLERRSESPATIKTRSFSPANSDRSALSVASESRSFSPASSERSAFSETRSFSPASSDRSALSDTRSFSPSRGGDRHRARDPVRAGRLQERASDSPVRDTFRGSPVPERRSNAAQDKGLNPAQESLGSRLRDLQTDVIPGLSRNRRDQDSSPLTKTLKDSRDIKQESSSKRDVKTDAPNGDFRSVLSNRQKSVDRNGNNKFATQTPAEETPSWVRTDKPKDDKKSGRDFKKTVDTDFRSVLKNRSTSKETKSTTAGVSKDQKANVQSKPLDFKSVLAKVKNNGSSSEEPKKNGLPSDRSLNSKAVSKDINSIKSKFETPAHDFRSVQLKPSKPQVSDQALTDSPSKVTSSKPEDRITARSRDTDKPKTAESTTSEKTPTTSETTTGGVSTFSTPKTSSTVTTTASADTPNKPSEVYISVADSSKYTDKPIKTSDSSQWSDISAISSAFSKLSEFSDHSEDSSPRSDSGLSVVDVQDSLNNRRRLDRLRGDNVSGNGVGVGGRGGGGGTTTTTTSTTTTGGGGGSSRWTKREREVSSEAPSIQQRLEDQSVTYGGKAVFQCKVSGTPEPDVNWSVNRKTIKQSKFFQLTYTQHLAQLVVSEAFSEDEGEYTCTATNTAGTDSCSCILTVDASSSRSSRSGSHAFEGPVSTPPRVLSLAPHNLTVRRGQPIRLDVTFSGEPYPQVKWFLSKRELTSDDHFSIMTEAGSSSLSIGATTANDGGRYTVTITNDLGTDLQAANVHVEDVPEPPVGRPHVYDVSRRSVSLSWCGPAYDGGCMVTHYAIEVKDNISLTWTTLVPDCQSTSHHALTLTPDRSYEFRVRAGNKLGLSQPSLATESVTMQDPVQLSEDYESDGCSEVFSPTVSYRGRDELPFEPREVKMVPGRKFEDHYEYLHEVGRGKFGNVYKCRDKTTSKIWAAKVLKVREKDKENVMREMAVMNRLAHPKLLMLWDAFEAPRTMVLVMEFVGAGELFERVIRDDFVLTERDCVHFVRQICAGVGYMHSQDILHLDLKPENVLCVADNSNQVKIIDFGLARFYKPGDSLQVLFGTPEFIAPEVINYDEIGTSTDLWSIGVICYILLSGLSPFLGDSDAETLANVTSGDYDFDDESFEDVSDNSKDFIQHLLVKRKEKRMTILQCEEHPWLAQEDQRTDCKRLNTDRLRCFMARRKWQFDELSPEDCSAQSGDDANGNAMKAGNAFRALGRMASLQKLLTGGSTTTTASQSSAGSLSSIPDTPDPLTPTPGDQFPPSPFPDSPGRSTPVQSQPRSSPPKKGSPLADYYPVSSSATAAKVVEEDGDEENEDSAATTTTTTTTSTAATTTATTRTTTTRTTAGRGGTPEDGEREGARGAVAGRIGVRTVPGLASPSSRRRAWDEQHAAPVQPQPPSSSSVLDGGGGVGSRFKPTATTNTAATTTAAGIISRKADTGGDETDCREKDSNDNSNNINNNDKSRLKPSPLRATTNTITTNDSNSNSNNSSNGISPNLAQHPRFNNKNNDTDIVTGGGSNDAGLVTTDDADASRHVTDDDTRSLTTTRTTAAPEAVTNSSAGQVVLAPPSFLREMVDCSAFPGDVVRFDVQVAGHPAPRLVWTLEDEEVEEDARVSVEVGEKGLRSLIVRQVSEDDEGEYSCRAVNSQGEVTCSADLSVYNMGAV